MTDTVTTELTPDTPDQQAPILRTTNLSKRFGRNMAVRDLNLTVERGSITGIVGPNGAGKSTTFLMLSTLLVPTAGTMEVCGADPVTQARDVRKQLGYMPDFFGIYDDLRVTEYLDFFAGAYGIGADRRPGLINDLLELVDLTVKREASVNSLSRGMKQRLCLARALVHDPDLLILDEPASGLDPRARIELRELMLELQRMGKTILISSHILSELQEVCSHIAILEAGSLVTQGAPDELVASFRTASHYTVTVPIDAVEALTVALRTAGIPVLEQIATGVVLELSGGEQEAADVLGTIVRAGVPVTGYTRLEADLEEIFLRVTKGTVK